MEVEKALNIIQYVIEKNVELTLIPIPVAVCIIDIYKKMDMLEKELKRLVEEKQNDEKKE